MDISAVVFLGASKFPNIPSFSNPSFKNSKSDFEDYLRQPSPSGLGVTSSVSLDLFDLPLDPGQQLKKISDFLDELKQGYPDATRNLIIYYCGHGYQSGVGGREYFLALAQTDRNVFDMTGMRFTSLSDVLKQRAKSFRYFYILDCCFAGQALHSFQGDSDAVGRLMTASLHVEGPRVAAEVPRRGAAALCATSPDDEARAPQGQRRTIFTDALVEVLNRGDKELRDAMTFAEVRDLAWEFIREKYKDVEENQIRPYLGSPDQTEGDIAAKVPLFPNPSSPRAQNDPRWQVQQERLEVQRQAAALREAEAQRQAAAKKAEEDRRKARADEDRRKTEETRQPAVQQPTAAPQHPLRAAPYGLYAGIAAAVAAVAVLAIVVIAPWKHATPAATGAGAGNAVQARSGTGTPRSSQSLDPHKLAIAVQADVSTYAIGTENVPARRVIDRLRSELTKQLGTATCFKVGQLDAGGDLFASAAQIGAGRLLVVQIDSLSYPRTEQHSDLGTLVSYAGDASLYYRIADVQTKDILLHDSPLSMPLPKLQSIVNPPVISAEETIDKVKTTLIGRMVPFVLEAMGCAPP